MGGRIAAVLALVLWAGCGGGGAAPSPCPHTSCPDPHPAGWATSPSADPALFHGTAARQRTDCVSCHDQADATLLCLSCHQAGGVTPHPAGWGASHTAAEIPGNAPADLGGGLRAGCLACHAG